MDEAYSPSPPPRHVKTLTISGHQAIARAAGILRHGGLVAFPTETVYGLGADATNDRAVASIFAAKGRPSFNPLIVHVASSEEAGRLVVMDERAETLASLFWPGPLTLILPRREDSRISLLCSAGLDTLAVRVPRHPIARGVLLAAGRPIAAPSANRAGRISPTSPEHVMAELDGRIEAVLDGGPCRVGIESTVIDLSGETARLLRPGGLAAEAIEAIIGPLARPDDPVAGESRASPGMMTSHYAPGLPVRLDVTEPRSGEAFIGFGPVADGIRQPDIQLSPNANPVEAAAGLFAALRSLDRPIFCGIAVMPIPQAGLGIAINDRLRRAAAPRSKAAHA